MNVISYTAPSGAPLNPTLTILDSRTLNVSWHPPPPVHQNGIITLYQIHVIEQDTNTPSQYNTTATWLLLSSLHPHYSYSLTFAAVTIAQGPFGSKTNVTMPEDGKQLIIVTIMSVSSNCI